MVETQEDMNERFSNAMLIKKLWSMFDILRTQPISTDKYPVALLFLSLYKDGIVSKDDLTKDVAIAEILRDCIKQANDEISELYEYLLQAFDREINAISFGAVFSMYELFQNLNQKRLQQEYPGIFDELLYKLSDSQGKYTGEFIQPMELTRLLCNIADPPKNAKVYNPFAGLASYGVGLDKNVEYYGQEYNLFTWGVGVLRLVAHNRIKGVDLNADDSIEHWPSSENKYELIISSPPFGVKLDRRYQEMHPGIRNYEQFLLHQGQESISDKGKLIGVFSQGVLFRDGTEKQLRKDLIEKDLIDTIISLPGGILKHTSIPLAVIVLNKKKRKKGFVRIIDASCYVIESKNNRGKTLDDIALLNSLIHPDSSENDRLISFDQIKGQDYNLTVSRYFAEDYVGVKLADLLSFERGSRGDRPQSGKLVQIRDLKDSNFEFHLDINFVDEKQLRTNVYRIDRSCLLLAIRWKSLKPTYYTHQGEDLYISQDILAFTVKESIVKIEYLVNELQSDYVKKQLDSFRVGATVPFIRKNDLLDIKIRVPSLEDQIAKVEGLSELSRKIQQLQAERNALAHGIAISQFNEFASLKHTLGRPRQNILDWTDNITHFLASKRTDMEVINRKFSEDYEKDLYEALGEIKRDINFITEVLEKGENGLILQDYALSVVPLISINDEIESLSDNGFNFTLRTTPLISENLLDYGIMCNLRLLNTLFDNLLTNANKHGFPEDGLGHEVRVEISEVEDTLQIEIKNNGEPFPKNFDKSKFVTKHSTANPELGTGLGGYDINRVAKYFGNSEWELILNEDPLYPVKFRFNFPIKPMD